MPPTTSTVAIPSQVPEQEGFVPCTNTVGNGVTITLMEVVTAHCPAFGVKVYVPDAVLLMTAGLQVPVIPFVDMAGSAVAAEPLQIGAIAANVGIVPLVTVIVSVAVFAHCPAFGVNVYVPDVVLLTDEGLHVPVIPFVEVTGKTGAAVPLQKAGMAANDGVSVGVTVMVNAVWMAHCPALGVKV